MSGDMTDRPYKLAWPVEDARREIVKLAGSHFDPDCVAAFEARWAEISALVPATSARLAG